MRIVDGYLSQRAGNTWSGAVVYKEEDGRYVLERPDAEPVSLGDSFGRAVMALSALRASVRRANQG